MNCPNCGRPLAEGEVCNCITPQENYYTPPQEPQAQPQEAQYAQPQQNTYYAQPAQPVQQTYYDPNAQQQFYAQQQVADIPARTDYPEGYKPKKKLIAVVLGATLGMFGIHNYYLGNNNKALAQLLVCLIGSLLAGLGFVVAYVWAIVETVLIFTEKNDKDANGYKIMTFEESMAKALKENDE